MVDAMNDASLGGKIPKSWGGSGLRWPLTKFFATVFSVYVATSSELLAQLQTVEIAIEPKLAASSPFPRATVVQTPLQTPLQTQSGKEPERLPQPTKGDLGRKAKASGRDDKKQETNFLPPQRPIGQISIDVRSKPKNGNSTVPENLADETMGQTPPIPASTSDEMHSDLVFTKSREHAELFSHHPLYFEEANLERYGRNCGPLQPAVSGLRFFATIPSLPYAMATHPPRKTYITKWPYEAGWGAPKVKELQPIQAAPTLVQTGAITGLLFVLP